MITRKASGVTLRWRDNTIVLPPMRTLAVPLAMMMMLAMLLLPLPPLLLDLLFTFNIVLALLVLIVAGYTVRPLDFAVFPSVLLVTTLLRLSLNVASTRQVLLHGHTGTDAAGKVIESFAQFLIGGNFAVGIIVFAILTVINFIVVTKGASRIAEVSARFALDAMPGKQMAIDADLNAGQIDQLEARRRRLEVGQEADFFGSMDGASKFVRGDAIAGLMILGINIVGGLLIGMLMHNLAFETAASNYVLLAIGDALVAQVPSLVISIAAGLVVSRVNTEDDIGDQLTKQLFSAPRALALACGVIALLGVVPGMPHFAFLSLAAIGGYAAWRLHQRQLAAAQPEPTKSVTTGNNDASWDDVTMIDTLALEVGYRLIPLVEKDPSSSLLSRVKGVRKKFAAEIGFLPPPVHIRDNLELRPNSYRVLLKGVVLSEAQVYPGQSLAINPGHVSTPLNGTQTVDPAFGLAAVWIDQAQCDAAQLAGYTVVDAATVVATHLHHLMQSHAASLLGRSEVQQLLEHLGRFAPKLPDELTPKLISLAVLQRVLQSLLEESVALRDLRTIVETLTEHAAKTQDPAELTLAVRIALAPAIVQQIYGPVRELSVIAFEPALESLLAQTLAPGASTALEPGVAEYVSNSAKQAAQSQEDAGAPATLLVPDRMRLAIVRLLHKAVPRLRVLAHAEIPNSMTIRIDRIIGEPQ